MGNKSSGEFLVHESFQNLHKNLSSESKQIVKDAFIDEYDVKFLIFNNF